MRYRLCYYAVGLGGNRRTRKQLIFGLVVLTDRRRFVPDPREEEHGLGGVVKNCATWYNLIL